MRLQNLTLQNARSLAKDFWPLCLWLMLFMSIQAGDIRNIRNFGADFAFIQGLRATIPLITAFIAVVIIGWTQYRDRPGRSIFLGPLGLAAVYGLVGVIASTLSPRGADALYWAVIYLSVPLVIWAIVRTPSTAHVWISRLIALNWLIFVVASAVIFAFGLIFLSLGDFLISPSQWLDCTSHGWFDKTSEYLRSTGVGRYAAITGIIALARLWHREWRILWGLVLVASIILLFYSGARTSFVGFSAAVPVVIFLSGGRRAALYVLMIGLILAPVVWVTEIHQEFLENCIFRASLTTGLENQNVVSVSPVSEAVGKTNIPLVGVVSNEFFNFSGRTHVWRQGLELFTESPFLGYGFQADRYLLGTHAHNSLVQSLLQTGVIGTIPFITGLMLAWVLLIKISLNLYRFPHNNKPTIIQVAGLLAYLSVRSITESTGAFFSIDWLLLGPILLHLQVTTSHLRQEEPSQLVGATAQMQGGLSLLPAKSE